MFIREFSDPGCQDVREVGGKAAGLAEMTADGLPVAPGFAVTAAAYRSYLEAAACRNLSAGCSRAWAAAGTRPPSTTPSAHRRTAQHGADPRRRWPTQSARPMPSSASDTGVDEHRCGRRSSATAEDSVGASFAGEFETWVDIVGADAVLDVRAQVLCQRLRRPRPVLPRREGHRPARHRDGRGDPEDRPGPCRRRDVHAQPHQRRPVQDCDRGQLGPGPVRSGRRGHAGPLCGGQGGPAASRDRTPGDKIIEYRRGDAPVEVPADRRHVLCLQDDEVVALAALGKKLERMHQAPQDIEFAVDEELPEGSNLILLQCRPETVWSNAVRKPAFDATAGMMSWITGSISGAATPPAHAHDASHQH